MRRREFITLLGGVPIAWPLAAPAQQSRVARVAILITAQAPERIQSLQTELGRLGWNGGGNLQFDQRISEADPAKIKAAVTELLDLKPDVIVSGGTTATAAFIEQSKTIPIIFATVGNPVESGFVSNLARPDANATGFLQTTPYGKMVELLKELAPRIKRVVVVHNPATDGGGGGGSIVVDDSARKLGLEPSESPINTPAEIESVLAKAGSEPDTGIIDGASPFTFTYRVQIAVAALRFGLPLVSNFQEVTRAGGLASYGTDPLDDYRRAAVYVDRILKGAKVADLPVQAQVKFQLCINLKTARTLSLEIPQATLALADEVVE